MTLNAKKKQYKATRIQLATNTETRIMKQEQLDTVVAYLNAHTGVVGQVQEQEQKVTGIKLDIQVAARTIDCVNKEKRDLKKEN